MASPLFCRYCHCHFCCCWCFGLELQFVLMFSLLVICRLVWLQVVSSLPERESLEQGNKSWLDGFRLVFVFLITHQFHLLNLSISINISTKQNRAEQNKTPWHNATGMRGEKRNSCKQTHAQTFRMRNALPLLVLRLEYEVKDVRKVDSLLGRTQQ